MCVLSKTGLKTLITLVHVYLIRVGSKLFRTVALQEQVLCKSGS